MVMAIAIEYSACFLNYKSCVLDIEKTETTNQRILFSHGFVIYPFNLNPEK